MNESKLLRLLGKTAPDDWNALSKFLQSPYHNSNKKLTEFHCLLSKFYPNFSDSRLTKEKVFKKLFPKKKMFDQKQFANLMSHFLSKTNAFFTIRQLEKKSILKERLLGEYYEQQGWYPLYKKNTFGVLKTIEQLNNPSSEDYFHDFWLRHRYIFHPETPRISGSHEQYEKTIKSLSNWSVLEILKLACEIKSRATFLSKEIPVPFLPQVKEYAQQLSLPGHTMFLMTLQLLETRDLLFFDEVTIYFFKHLDYIHFSDQLNLYTIFLNFANQTALQGKTSFYKKVFELNKKGLKLELLMEHNQIHSAHFSNIVIVGILVNELSWTKKFIKDYQNILDPEDQFILTKYCEARILAAENNFKKALANLYEIEGLQHDYSFRVRSALIRCLYELFLQKDSYYDTLISRTESFEKHISRDQTWHPQRKKSYINFCRTIHQFLNLQRRPSAKLQASILEDLKTIPLVGRQWFFKKLEQFNHQ